MNRRTVAVVSIIAVVLLVCVSLGAFFMNDIVRAFEKDTDGDGIPDKYDLFPNDYDNDGYDDDIDLYPRSDVGFVFTISTIEVKDNVGLFGSHSNIYFTLKIDGMDQGRIDNSGETWSCEVGTPKSVNEEFRFNIDDDQRTSTIELTMVNEYLITRNILDIDGSSQSGRTLIVTFDIVTKTWTGNDVNGLADGSADGTHNSDDDDGAVWFDIDICTFEETKTYEWEFQGTDFSLQAVIPTSDYAEYRSSTVSRDRHNYDDAQTFVTSGDPIIAEIASELKSMAQARGFSEVQTINFALRFCQSIDYSYDNVSMGADEYWRFPVETLYDETGDCEDTSFLFASIAEAMGYDAVIVFLPEHMGVGVASSQASGDHYIYQGAAYYYCETTGEGFVMGEMPEELKDSEARLVQVQ